jgi:hypothetical protein
MREGSDGSSNVLRRSMETGLRKWVSLVQEDHLNWPKTRKTVAHIINPRGNHTIRLCHWFSTTRRLEVSLPSHFRRNADTGYCVGVNFRKHRVIWGGWRMGYSFLDASWDQWLWSGTHNALWL